MERIRGIIARCEDSDAIFICDRQGYIAYYRSPFNRFFNADGIVGKHILDIFPHSTAKHHAVMQALDTGETMIDKVAESVTHQGDHLMYLTTVIPVRVGGELVGAVDSTKFYLSSRIWAGSGDELPRVAMKGLAGKSQMLVALRDKADMLAEGEGPVLLYGEPGAGKVLAACAIHRSGPRGQAPFLHQNCAELPAPILECVLFGTEADYYPGAIQRPGLLERAEGGTLYLTQIDEMSSALQKKLLQVLQTGVIQRLGGTQDIPVQARLICALNRTPRSSIMDKKLIEPLYRALRDSKMDIPPLRGHREDVLLIAQQHIQSLNRETGREVKGLSPLAEGLLQTYGWPGNIRELYSTLESAFHSSNGDCILVEDLREILSPEGGAEGFQEQQQEFKSGFSLNAALEAYERNLIRQALSQTSTVAEAARLLGLSRQLLQYKMQKFDL